MIIAIIVKNERNKYYYYYTKLATLPQGEEQIKFSKNTASSGDRAQKFLIFTVMPC